jgi:hypothetical protein
MASAYSLGDRRAGGAGPRPLSCARHYLQDEDLASTLALRGGTALHKLHFSPARRYSNDIDLVQLQPGPFGATMDRLRAQLDG